MVKKCGAETQGEGSAGPGSPAAGSVRSCEGMGPTPNSQDLSSYVNYTHRKREGEEGGREAKI